MADAQQRSREGDQIVEIGEPRLALGERIGFGEPAAEMPCRRQIVGDAHRGRGAEQALPRLYDPHRMVEAVLHLALFAGIIGAQIALAGQETAEQFAQHRRARRRIGDQPADHHIVAGQPGLGAPVGAALRDRPDIGVGDRAVLDRFDQPRVGIAGRQRQRLAQVVRAWPKGRGRPAEDRGAARQEGKRRIGTKPAR